MNPTPEDNGLDEPAFSLLESYLQDLHAGRAPDSGKLLEKHPELAGALSCLEALDRLAPTPDAGPEAAAPPDDPDYTRTWKEKPAPVSPGAVDFSGFEKYELLEKVGRGGMGVVYKARQRDLDRLVALKMVGAGHLASEEELTRFHGEARAAARLRHPNIVALHEVGEIHGQPYLAMDFVAGPSLAQVLRGGAVSAETAARWVSLVARAVAYLHSQGMVHRDLKPSNILLDEQGCPFVTDFGLVKTLGADNRLTGTGAIVGTPSYMAPEQAAGRTAEVGIPSDVYSLGTILYELLTGRPPFHEETPLDTLVQVLESEPLPPSRVNPDVPMELELICLKCLEKAPEQRYRSAEALAEDLERFLRGEVVEARPQGVWQHLRRWVRREPALVSRLSVLAVCAAIIQVRAQLSAGIDWHLHAEVMAILATWAVTSLGFQWCLRRWPSWDLVRLAWAGVDALLFTALLEISEALGSPLVAGYFLLVGASGLWFRVPLILWTTGLAAAGYAFLILLPYLRGGACELPHYHLMLLVALVGLGLIVAFQVHRVRTLSRYYQRPLAL